MNSTTIYVLAVFDRLEQARESLEDALAGFASFIYLFLNQKLGPEIKEMKISISEKGNFWNMKNCLENFGIKTLSKNTLLENIFLYSWQRLKFMIQNL